MRDGGCVICDDAIGNMDPGNEIDMKMLDGDGTEKHGAGDEGVSQ